MTDIPHFSLPFRFVGGKAIVNEQDSLEEIADCALAIVLCPRGFRVELLEFGVTDPTFETQPVNSRAIQSAVEQWEPRAAAEFSAAELVDQVQDALAAHLRMNVHVRTEE